jgi:serine/threonine protein kinase
MQTCRLRCNNNKQHIWRMAPEILRGQKYIEAADIYSFGIIMYEVISGLPPYYDTEHDENLAIKIYRGLRPRFNIEVPFLILYLIKRCLDANPINRPTAREISEILIRWFSENDEYNDNNRTELKTQVKKAAELNILAL